MAEKHIIPPGRYVPAVPSGGIHSTYNKDKKQKMFLLKQEETIMGFFSKLCKGPEVDKEKSSANAKKMRLLFN